MLANRYTVVGLEDEFEGRSFRDWIVYTKSRNGFGKLAMLCQAVDPAMVSAARDPDEGFNARLQSSVDYHLLGQVFAGKVEHEPRSYDDKNGKRVDTVSERIVEFRVLSDRELATLEADYNGEPRPALPDDAREDWDAPRREGGGRSHARGDGGTSSSSRGGSGFDDDEIPF